MTTNHDDFWGESADWPEVPERTRREPRASAGKTVSRWWNNVIGGGMSTANREHGVTRGHAVEPIDLDDEPLNINPSGEHAVIPSSAADPSTESSRPASRPVDRSPSSPPGDEWDGDWEIDSADNFPPAPRPGVDPLLARLGGAAIVLTLFVPLVLGIGSGDDKPTANAAAVESPAITLVPPADASLSSADIADTTPAEAPSTQSVAAIDASPATNDAVAAVPVASAPVASAPVASAPVAAPVTTIASTSAADAAPSSTQVFTTGAAASGTADRVAENCAVDYTVVAGDFWIRLADAADIPLDELLDANDATVDTALYPGSTICLPEGATVSSPPSTTTPATTQAPASVATNKPATTTPTSAKPVVTYPTPSVAAAQQIIRDVWPDELEDRAIEIAGRESTFVATARNSCCYGLFQINWTAHKEWLAGLGITSAEQLFDATNNAYAAYALYQRSGGWGPWT